MSRLLQVAALACVVLAGLAAAQGQDRPARTYGQMIIPPILPTPVEPATRTLPAEEAEETLRRDWLFQAMGEPLAQRAGKEIVWARELATRLGGKAAGELAELETLEKRLAALAGRPVVAEIVAARGAPVGESKWIWHPEADGSNASQDAPVAPRWFRKKLDLPAAAAAAVRRAEFRVTADDAFEAFVNGTRLGAGATWKKAESYDVTKLLKGGANVLAVRAENQAAPVQKNPAGLIARLIVTLSDGREMVVASDATWVATKDEPAGPQWQQAAFDDSTWKPAAVAAAFGAGPWGRIEGLMEAVGGGARDPAIAAYDQEDPAVRELYFAVRHAKRRIALANPVLDFTRILLVDQPMPVGPVHPQHESVHRMGITACPPGRLLVLDGLHPGGAVRKLAPAPSTASTSSGQAGSGQAGEKSGYFWRPDLSFDATRVLFCFKPYDQKSFHLYEVGLDLPAGSAPAGQAGGAGLRQLTDSDYDDIDPIYLPDGHILFTTTRGNTYVRCGPFIYSYILARCDADGRNVYLISQNAEPDFVPSLMADGRVIYSRWEYTDKPLWRDQSLWTVNPDGTNVATFWGSQSAWPDHKSQPREIPGSRRVMFCGVGHHDWWAGCIGIIDPVGGAMNFPDGLTKVTRDLPWPESGNGAVDPGESPRYHPAGKFTGWTSPYPLGEQDFLACGRGAGDRFRLYLMDVDGNRELIYEGLHNVLDATPIRVRPRPAALPDRVVWPGTGKDRKPLAPGWFYTPDVYQGATGLARGSAKYLRVVQQDHKTYSTWEKTYRNSGPAVSIVQEESVKRILGEVPIQEDGSVYFQAPPGRSLFFQILDKDYRCLQTMRSFSGLMPGETRGCLGCHEMHSATPPHTPGLAFRRGPVVPTPTPWGQESIGYERFAQPVLDKYCGRCHQGEGQGRKKLDLTLRPGEGPFKEPYLTLVGSAGWGNPAHPGPGWGIAAAIPVESQGSYTTIPPMTYLSYKSPLIERAMSGKHHDVKVEGAPLRRLMAWVDACCPFAGEEEVRALPDPDFPGIERLPIRPLVKTAPVIERP
jgi:hypothetical protein